MRDLCRHNAVKTCALQLSALLGAIIGVALFGCTALFAHDSNERAEDRYWHTDINAAMRQPDKVYKLRLPFHKRYAIPENIAILKNLRELEIPTMPLAGAAATFRKILQLTWLRRLTLPGHEIDSLPADIVRLHNLESLSMRGEEPNYNDDLPTRTFGARPDPFAPPAVVLWNNSVTYARLGELPLLRELDLSSNYLDSLPRSFGSLTRLQNLILAKCGLRNLPDEFGKLGKLRKLNLIFNPIAALPPSMSGLRQLDSLFLSGDPRSLDVATVFMQLAELPKLRFLNLLSYFPKLPQEIGLLKNLEMLYVQRNDVTELPESIVNLSNLRVLDISYNRIRELPPGWDKLRNLRELDLAHNRDIDIDNVCAQLAAAPQLSRLDIAYCGFRNVPAAIGKLSALTELNLARNGLKSLPDEIGALHNIRKIILSNNRLTDLPDAMAGMRELRELRLHSNRLKTLPECIAAFSHLELLALSGNPITERIVIPDSLHSLKKLYVKNINFTEESYQLLQESVPKTCRILD